MAGQRVAGSWRRAQLPARIAAADQGPWVLARRATSLAAHVVVGEAGGILEAEGAKGLARRGGRRSEWRHRRHTSKAIRHLDVDPLDEGDVEEGGVRVEEPEEERLHDESVLELGLRAIVLEIVELGGEMAVHLWSVDAGASIACVST